MDHGWITADGCGAGPDWPVSVRLLIKNVLRV